MANPGEEEAAEELAPAAPAAAVAPAEPEALLRDGELSAAAPRALQTSFSPRFASCFHPGLGEVTRRGDGWVGHTTDGKRTRAYCKVCPQPGTLVNLLPRG